MLISRAHPYISWILFLQFYFLILFSSAYPPPLSYFLFYSSSFLFPVAIFTFPHNFSESHATTMKLCLRVFNRSTLRDVVETAILFERIIQSVKEETEIGLPSFLCKLLTLEFVQQRQATSFIT